MPAYAAGEPGHAVDLGVIMSRWDNLVVGSRSQRALLLFALAAAVAMAPPVLAQNGQKPTTPSRPFQEKSDAPGPLRYEKTTPQTLADELEGWAKRIEGAVPLERQDTYSICHAANRAEFDAFAHYSLLILTVVTQSADELPVKRVYLRMPDRELPLLKIASWRRNVDQALATYKMYGPYREDGFYLFPLSAYLRIAQLQADLAANRSGLPLIEFPSQGGPEWPWRTLPNPDPLPGTLPTVRALQALIKGCTSGFPIPTSLPQVAPEARRPAAEPTPQPAPDYSKRSGGLTDILGIAPTTPPPGKLSPEPSPRLQDLFNK